MFVSAMKTSTRLGEGRHSEDVIGLLIDETLEVPGAGSRHPKSFSSGILNRSAVGSDDGPDPSAETVLGP
jgi:hypothetical protein